MSVPPLSILIIDDCPEDREILVRYFDHMTQQEFHIIQTDSGEEGWDICQKEQLDCILIDYQMPDLDGLEFIQLLSKEEEQRFLPVLMLTGQGNEDVASEAMKCGASDYLVKSKLTSEGLLRAVMRAIEKSQLLRTNYKQHCEIERSYRELEQFAYTASHDLQAPIRRITKFLELIQMDHNETLSDRSKDYLDRALKGAAHMRLLIQDLLNYSHIGGAEQQFDPVHLEDVLKEVLAQLEVMIDNTTATVDVKALPIVMGNHMFLHQLFQNLIANALKFRSDHQPHVEISSRCEDAKCTVTVKDNGVGIPSEAFEKIFGIFQRIDSSSHIEGTGIGLALCKKIIELHEGHIWVESTVNEGTAFHFTLPSCVDQVAKERPQPALTATSS
jgi:signal transduction histidine kinase